MSPNQIKELVAQWIDSELERTEQAKAEGGTNDLEDAEDYKDVYGTLLEEADEARQMNQQWRVKDLALELTTRHGLTMEPGSPEFGRLCHELLKGRVELLREEIRRVDGEYRPLGNGHQEARQAATKPTVPTVTKPFSVVFEKYLSENKERQPRTQSQIRSGFLKFMAAIGGDKPVGEITREHGRTYKEAMLAKKLGAASVNKYLHGLSHCIEWAKANSYLPQDWPNPIKGLMFSKKVVRKQATKSIPFTDDELATIFGDAEFTGWKTRHPEYYYGLLALLLTAARREEVYQLDKADVQRHVKTGVWCFNFIDGGDEDKEKTVKNEMSRRVVPLPDLLIELGFLEYVKGVNHKRVFPQLKHERNGYGDAPGKAWARLVKRLGFKAKGKVLHSLRHGGITKMGELGVPYAHAVALTGHTGGNSDIHFTDYTHMKTFSLTVMKKSMDVLGESYREMLKGLPLICSSQQLKDSELSRKKESDYV
jgi:integrase